LECRVERNVGADGIPMDQVIRGFDDPGFVESRPENTMNPSLRERFERAELSRVEKQAESQIGSTAVGRLECNLAGCSCHDLEDELAEIGVGIAGSFHHEGQVRQFASSVSGELV